MGNRTVVDLPDVPPVETPAARKKRDLLRREAEVGDPGLLSNRSGRRSAPLNGTRWSVPLNLSRRSAPLNRTRRSTPLNLSDYPDRATKRTATCKQHSVEAAGAYWDYQLKIPSECRSELV